MSGYQLISNHSLCLFSIVLLLVAFPSNFRRVNSINTDIYFLTNDRVKAGKVEGDTVDGGCCLLFEVNFPMGLYFTWRTLNVFSY